MRASDPFEDIDVDPRRTLMATSAVLVVLVIVFGGLIATGLVLP